MRCSDRAAEAPASGGGFREVRITASIVTYRSGAVIGPCLASLPDSTRRPLDVVILDNASDDDTPARIAACAGPARVILSPSNLGFGQGHNRALAEARDGYFLLLNPDVILAAGSLDRLADHLDAHPECGAAGPLLAEGGDGKIGGFESDYPGHEFLPPAWRELPGAVAFLKGACVLIRSEVYRRIGGFDPRFFLYAEDLDLGLQVRRAGYTLACLPDVTVRHAAGHTEATRTPRAVAAQKYGSLLQFYEKNYPPAVTRRLVRRDRARFVFRSLVYRLTPGPGAARKRSEYLGRLEALRAFGRRRS